MGGVGRKLLHRRFPQGSGYNGRRPLHGVDAFDKETKKSTMDPARPNDPDPADPFIPERADHAVLETIEIATEGEDCDECVRKLRPLLMKIPGGARRRSRSSARTRDRDIRCAQNARAGSTRRNFDERLQTGGDAD